MFSDPALLRSLSSLALSSAIIDALRKISSPDELASLMESITRARNFRHYALIHHDELRVPRSDLVDFKDYPVAIAQRLIGEQRYRRDPSFAAASSHRAPFFGLTYRGSSTSIAKIAGASR